MPRSYLIPLLGFALAAGTVAAFRGVRECGFVNYDDPVYVAHNDHVKGGLSGPDFWWALTTTETSNRHPLTWLSLQLDAQFFGPDPAAFHRTNLLLHVVAVLLLFLALYQMTE